MYPKKLVVFGFLISLLVLNSLVHSKDRIFDAIGYDVIYNGISFKKIRTDGRSIQLILSAKYETKYRNVDKDELDITVVIRFRNRFLSHKKLILDRFLGASIIRDDSHRRDATQTNIYFSAGFIPEIFLFDHFSVEIPLGIRVGIIGESSTNAGDNRILISTYGSGISLVGNIAFHFYF